jgi:hypothetical protein
LQEAAAAAVVCSPAESGEGDEAPKKAGRKPSSKRSRGSRKAEAAEEQISNAEGSKHTSDEESDSDREVSFKSLCMQHKIIMWILLQSLEALF